MNPNQRETPSTSPRLPAVLPAVGEDADASTCFSDEAEATRYLEQCFWNGKPLCPWCASPNVAARTEQRSWRCNACRKDFTVRTGTLFARSHLPLHIWLRAIRLIAGKDGDEYSSAGLGRELNIRQASAWQLLRRLRDADAALLQTIAAGFAAAPARPRTTPIAKKDAPMAMSRQELASLIYDGIKDGSLTNGDKLPPEREIAVIFNTSRGAVREAIIVLETLGFIEVRGKEGVFVRTLTEEECNRSLEVYTGWPSDMLPHAFQVRLLLESEAAGLAAVNRTDEDVKRMRTCIEGLLRIFRERPVDWNIQGGTLNELFHKLILEAAHNPVLLRMHEGLLRITKRAYSAFGTDRMVTPIDQWEERVIKAHGEILGTIERQDEQAARDIMRNHLEITFNKLDSLYRERIDGVLHR